MNKLLTAVLLSSVITLSVQAQKAEEYYVKHVEFPPNATLEQKVDMAARLIPTPQQLSWQQMELTAFSISVSTLLPDANGETEKKILHFSTLRNWMPNNGCAALKMPDLKWCF